jgi:uncharacterized OsmC-like protein
MAHSQSTVLQRQAPLRAAYQEHPQQAVILKRAKTVSAPDSDAFHGVVIPGDNYGVAWRFGIDRAVGGFHDAPNPGELLCATLAACEDATIRMVAEALGVTLEHLEVEVIGAVDVRGALAVDRRVAVGFQSMECKVHVALAPDTRPQLGERLLAEAERSCINLATLRAGISVDVAFNTTRQERTAWSAI